MIVLGVDPASVKLGYGVIRAVGETLTFLDAGVISAPAGWDKYRRLAEIGRELDAIFSEHAIDAVAMEAGFIASQQGALTSGAARGVAGYLAARRGIPVTEYAPATVKKAATGHGGSDKEAVAEMVRRLFRLRVAPAADAGDALAVGICHIRTAGSRVRTGRAA